MSKSKLILSLDPGGTTGYSLLHLPDNKSTVLATVSTTINYERFWQGGQIGPDEHHKALWHFLSHTCPDQIICEDFVYQIRRNRGVEHGGIPLISRDYIGIVKLYHQLTGKPLEMQQPSIIGTTWVNDDALKKFHVYEPGMPHQNDAARHLLYYLVTKLNRKEILTLLRDKK